MLKFVDCSMEAFLRLENPDENTLYFVRENDLENNVEEEEEENLIKREIEE